MRRILVLSILLVGFFIKSFSQTEVISLWKGVQDCSVKNRRSTLTISRPADSLNNNIAIIICPGGSYCYLGMNIEGYSVAKLLNDMGFTTFVLKYSVGMYTHKHPDMIEDLQRSIQIVRENYDEWDINPSKVGVMGFSAGGHLAGISSIFFDTNFIANKGTNLNCSLKPDFVAMIYPVVSLYGDYAHKKSSKSFCGGTENIELQKLFSLDRCVKHDIPPIFLVHAKDDKTVDYRNSTNFYDELQKQGINSTCLLYDTGGHGFGIDKKKGGDTADWIYEFVKWVKGL